MNQPDFQALMRETFDKALALQEAKGLDYSGANDALRTLKTQGAKFNIAPEQAWGVLADKGWQAICTYAATGKLGSEPLEQRVLDIINYAVFILALAKERDQAIDKNDPDPAREAIDRNVASLQAGILSTPDSGSQTIPHMPQTVVESSGA